MLRFWEPWEERWGALGRALELFRDFRGFRDFVSPKLSKSPEHLEICGFQDFQGFREFGAPKRSKSPENLEICGFRDFQGFRDFRAPKISKSSENIEIAPGPSPELPRAPPRAPKISKYQNI